MVDEARARRFAMRIQEIIALWLERGVKDPRIGFVTITEVKVTPDLLHATVFYTVYGTDEEQQETTEGLLANTGQARKRVGSGLGVKNTPTIEFVRDTIPESSERIAELLREARERDAAVAAATGLEYAGDPDPYVKPRDLEDSE